MRSFGLAALIVMLLVPLAAAEDAVPAEKETVLAKAVAETPADSPGTLETLRRDVNSLMEWLNIEFYGHIKLDSSRDSAETNFGNTAFFVKNYGDGDKDEEINITARHTRFGMNWKGPEYEGINASAKIEIDFLGKAVQKNTETMELQGAVRMRHAWMKFDFGDGWSMLAGQAWDVFGPVLMKKVNTMVGWGQGNVAFRRPQLRLTKITPAGDKSKVTVQFAIARPVARDSSKLDGDSQDDGEDAGVPDLQAHISLSTPIFCDKPANIGIGGFIGWREVGEGGSLSDEEKYTSHAICLDFTLPITKDITVLGEAWMGKAMDGYRGGVWQSYTVCEGELETISAKGGFLNVMWKPHKLWRVVVGHGFDDPDDDDFCDNEGRYRNSTTFVNVMYKFYKSATVAIEYDRMKTEYRDDDVENDRFQITFMLKF